MPFPAPQLNEAGTPTSRLAVQDVGLDVGLTLQSPRLLL